MPERVLVTGGTGFVGAHIARALLDEGSEVVAMDTIEPDHLFPSDAEFIRGDVCQIDDVRRAARGCDAVVANAALVPLTQAGAEEFMRVNAGGAETTLRVAQEIDAYAAYVSSSAIFGIPDHVPLDNHAEMNPFEPYGASKAQAERVVRSFRSRGLPVASLRPRTLVGPGRLGLFEVIFGRVAAEKTVPLFGSGHNKVQLADVTDYASAVVAAIRKRAVGDFNIGAKEFGTVREDIEGLIAAVGSRSRVQPIPVWMLKAVLVPATHLRLSPFSPWHWNHASKNFYFDISESETELDWTPRFSNVESLIAAYREHEGPSAMGGSAHRKPVSRAIGRLLRL
jgi:nucleoside-diphosphate-sugar epimerase